MSVTAGSVIFRSTTKASSTSATLEGFYFCTDLMEPCGHCPIHQTALECSYSLRVRIPYYSLLYSWPGQIWGLGSGCIGTVTIHKEYGAFIYAKLSFLWLMKVSIHKSQ